MTTVVAQCPKCGFKTKLIRDASGSLTFPLGHELAESCEYLIDQKARGGPIHDWMCPHLKDEVERSFPPVIGEP